MTMRLLVSAAIFSLMAFTSCQKATPTPAAINPEAITVVPQSAVPAAIVASFNSSFAGATEVEWHKSNNHFEVEFNHQNLRQHSSFDDNGHESSHSVSCTSGPVPAVVLAAFRARYPNDNVFEWSLQNDGSWKAHFTRNSVRWETSFSAAGTFIKEEHD